MFTTINDLYDRYSDLFGSDQPVWSRDQLLDWKTRLGKRYEEITAEDLDAAYEESVAEALSAGQGDEGDRPDSIDWARDGDRTHWSDD